VTPIVSVDRFPVDDGQIGPITAELQKEYEDVIRGKNPEYSDWLLPVYS